jgi:phosphatidylglycerophosphate synthase
MMLSRHLAALAVVAGGGLAASLPAVDAAEDSAVLSVAGVAVDVTAADAEEAKAQAVAVGQRRAIERLFKRLIPISAQDDLPGLEDGMITELVRGFEVADERVAPDRYIASLTVHFKPNGISRFLRDLGIPYAVTPSRPVVVLPLFRNGGELFLWEDDNAWRSAWASLPLADGLIRVVTPVGELADLALIDARQADEGDAESLGAIAKRYGAKDVVVAEAEVANDPLFDAPVARITLRRFYDTGIRIGGGTYSGDAPESLGAVLAIAAEEARTQLEEEWKEVNLLRFDRRDSLAVDIPISGLEDWLDIRARLVELALVRKAEISALSPGFARVILHYLGDVRHLSDALDPWELGARVNLANLISLARLCAAPLIIWLILTDELALAFWLFLAAAVSDAVDGFVAKRFGGSTVIGTFLDPIADKALLVGVYIALGDYDDVGIGLPLWLVILVVFRDMLIIGGAILFRLVTRALTMSPLMISKINTVTQIVLAAVTLGRLGLDFGTELVVEVLVYMVAATTLASGGAYVVGWTRRAAGAETPE